ncbi:uncharacterized protein BDR25DRAFT_351897 [Lindgomyces ingoldianus]|uniref:Uncharacterized protein n=1 Tax=Lindgomyces ingoldianus TaxID=673940 RepID=A0ACB6R5J9_9PLEO|nr:uncharacterized protein BDR25DRAFT_351897 [Lindgomyces ingoldianus]KAF2474347.1 hypothetical protein BDR25DRAFT_351897 [Lindgomyces ingoldianus]
MRGYGELLRGSGEHRTCNQLEYPLHRYFTNYESMLPTSRQNLTLRYSSTPSVPTYSLSSLRYSDKDSFGV